jgi:hypothetical protein
MRPLNIWWYLCYNFIHIYCIKFSNEKIGLNTILTSQFQTYLFLTFIILKFLKFCNWFTINPIEGSIVSKWKLNLLSCVFVKNCPFFNLIFFRQLFLYTLQCFHPSIVSYYLLSISSSKITSQQPIGTRHAWHGVWFNFDFITTY